MKHSRQLSVILCVLVWAGLSSTRATGVQMNIPPGSYAKTIGKTALADPSGTTHTRQDVAGKVVVAIFSAPNMTQGGQQEKWSDLLSTQPASKLPDKVALVLVEDMTQAGMFKGMALDSMKKQFTPHSRPFLILDQNGDVFKKFGVSKNKTEILIYDKTGKLRDVETNLADQSTTLQRIKSITADLE